MRPRIFFIYLTSFLLIFTLLQNSFAEEPPKKESTSLKNYNIAILTDGPMALRQNLVELFKQEVLQMAEGEFRVTFPEDMTLEADSTISNINYLIDTLLNNPETDLIIALGTIGSTESLKRTNLAKPVIAPFVFDTNLQKAPQDVVGSGIKNLFYLNLCTTIERELLSFLKLFPF